MRHSRLIISLSTDVRSIPSFRVAESGVLLDSRSDDQTREQKALAIKSKAKDAVIVPYIRWTTRWNKMLWCSMIGMKFE